ncbi:MAG: hypothetical protein NT069_06055, partial [Planctomycetota bacterium]|nr:hypothetical protein [Planctomycetota bacterium]
PAMPHAPTSFAAPPAATTTSAPPPTPATSQQPTRRNSPAPSKNKQSPPQNLHREPVTWTEAKAQRERDSGSSSVPGLESTAPRPAVDGSPPIRRTEEELRQTPEWKRASRSERKRLLRNVRVGIVPD